jgi:alkanesulfonate monooxygenase
MALKFHWFLPTSGDGRDLQGGGHGAVPRKVRNRREPSVAYLAQIARAAEQLGFEGALTPTGTLCEDAWITTAILSAHSEHLKFLVAFRPGYYSPTLAAHMAATYQRQTGGRLLVNVVTGGEPAEQRAYGDFSDKDSRYGRTDEFLQIVRALWKGATVDFTGQHLQVEQARLAEPPEPFPEVYFGGSSESAITVAARRAEVYLTWGEPPDQVTEKLDRVRKEAAAAGRDIRFGIRLHVIARATADEAWAEAARILSNIDPADIARAQAGLASSESEGQRRMRELHGGRTDDLEIYPNLWAGIGLLRGGAGTALVGSHEEIRDRILEYHALGIDEFIFSGYPCLEEAYRFGEGVLPLLADHGLWTHPWPGASTYRW